jgi:putative ABC transport system permease protein
MLRDLRHAVHTLRRSPGYTLLSIAVLSLGIGANAAIFSVLDSVVLHALPYPDADRLVFVWDRFPSLPPPAGPRMNVARRNFVEWQRQATVFSSMAGFVTRPASETSSGHPRHVDSGFASAALFPMLGATPRLGRVFTTENEHAGNDRVAVISDAFFDRRFQRNPVALGRSLTLDGIAYTVIGVLPPGFHLPATYEGSDQSRADVWIPLSRLPSTFDQEQARTMRVIARLKSGVTLAKARTEMDAIAVRLQQSDPELDRGWYTSVFDIRTEDTDPTVHRALYVLMATVGLLLLIACANLANLTIARATLRSRELAVRLALGATRTQLVSQLIAEPLLLSLCGAALGLLVAHWGIKLIVAYKPENVMRPELIAINLPVLLFAALAGVATTLLFGLLPSLTASRADLNTALKSGGGGAASAMRLRSRQALIALEVTLALVLVTGAGLMIRSFQELLAVGVGFRTERVALADIDLPADRYRDNAARARFFRELLSRAGAVPGIDAAAIVDNAPLHRLSLSNFLIQGRPDPPLNALPIADKNHVSITYFDAIGLRLEAGRAFTPADLALTEKGPNAVVIVNRAFVRQFFPNENPLGHRLLDGDRKQASEIVGIVADYRPLGVENGTRPAIFWPDLRLTSASLVMRSSASEAMLAKWTRDLVWSLDRELPAAEARPMAYYVDEWLSQRKFNTFLLGAFAALALILGMLGIYGVLAGLVASRVREIGIRMAIGATPGQIGGLVLTQSMLPVGVGLIAGLGASMVLGRFLESLLFHVNTRDPVALGLAVTAVLVAAPLAVWVPLRRATRVECTEALRQE